MASALPSFLSPALAAKRTPPAALLVPLTGPDAAIGRSMARAALLAQPDTKALLALDTAASPAAAAQTALKRGASLILGPVRSADVRQVVAAVGDRVPVLTFSNDTALLDRGAFLLGITPDQAVAPLLRFARGRGIRRIALATDAPWSTAATRAAAQEGLTLESLAASDLGALLQSADPPHAILFSSTPPMPASEIRAAGIQPLVAFTGLDASPATLAALEGAWISAPDPAAFSDFATAYESANGTPPGLLAGLARDGAAIAAQLARNGASDRAALLAMPRFDGVCGAVRFRADGSAARDMAILAVESGRYRVADRSGTA